MKKIIDKILHPFVWLFKRSKKKFNEIRQNSFNRLFIVVFPNFIFSLLGLGLILYNFKSMKEDTVNLTNYGFAILIGLSSVCFAWARGLKEDEDNEIVEITYYAESFLHCAVIFLITSAIKYAYLNMDELILKEWVVAYYSFKISLGLIHSLCFTLAFYKVDQAIRGLNALLYNRQNDDEM